MNREPEKMIKVENADRTVYALIVFGILLYLCYVVINTISIDKDLIHKQQTLIQSQSDQIKKYVSQINEMHGTVSFVVGRLAEQANLIRHKCTVLADLLQSELEQQQQMFQQLMIPNHEAKE
jgi:F0F1-type ATP synthase membrane subunit b/b'